MPVGQKWLFGGDWTEQKLDILSDYLCAYNTALKNQPFCRVYVDAFAGTGYRQQRQDQFQLASLFEEIGQDESQRFLKGSAKRALEARPAFNRYVFVESDRAKIGELESLKREHPDKAAEIHIEQGEANAFVQGYCQRENWQSTRAVLFLDPFATQVEWRTIEAIAHTKAIDVWILFPLMAVNRLLANDPEKACRGRLDRIFGTQDWFDAFYRTSKPEDIFGQHLEIVKKACDFERIGEFYLERLKSVFAGVAPKPRMLENSRAPLFQLFFAAANPKGAPIAVRIASHLLERM